MKKASLLRFNQPFTSIQVENFMNISNRRKEYKGYKLQYFYVRDSLTQLSRNFGTSLLWCVYKIPCIICRTLLHLIGYNNIPCYIGTKCGKEVEIFRNIS